MGAKVFKVAITSTGDQPELSKCMMPLLIKYQSKLVGDGLELREIDEHLLI